MKGLIGVLILVSALLVGLTLSNMFDGEVTAGKPKGGHMIDLGVFEVGKGEPCSPGDANLCNVPTFSNFFSVSDCASLIAMGITVQEGKLPHMLRLTLQDTSPDGVTVIEYNNGASVGPMNGASAMSFVDPNKVPFTRLSLELINYDANNADPDDGDESPNLVSVVVWCATN